MEKVLRKFTTTTGKQYLLTGYSDTKKLYCNIPKIEGHDYFVLVSEKFNGKKRFPRFSAHKANVIEKVNYTPDGNVTSHSIFLRSLDSDKQELIYQQKHNNLKDIEIKLLRSESDWKIAKINFPELYGGRNTKSLTPMVKRIFKIISNSIR